MITHRILQRALGALLLCAGPAAARPVLLELFTSQSCSSCPPAEALLGRLKSSRDDIVALEFHVDYWNALNWRDPYSSRAATSRQQDYAAALGSEVFTPQMVIDGRASAVGSDRAAIAAAITAAHRAQPAGPVLTVTEAGSGLNVTVGAGASNATLLLVGYDSEHTTAIPSGENGGTVLKEVNVVRSLARIAVWVGAAAGVTVPRPAGEHYAVFLQRADGAILAVSFAPAAAHAA